MFGLCSLVCGGVFYFCCSKIAKLEEELRLVNNALKTFEHNEEKVKTYGMIFHHRL